MFFVAGYWLVSWELFLTVILMPQAAVQKCNYSGTRRQLQLQWKLEMQLKT